MQPVPSMTCASAASMPGLISTIRPSRTSTSPRGNVEPVIERQHRCTADQDGATGSRGDLRLRLRLRQAIELESNAAPARTLRRSIVMPDMSFFPELFFYTRNLSRAAYPSAALSWPRWPGKSRLRQTGRPPSPSAARRTPTRCPMCCGSRKCTSQEPPCPDDTPNTSSAAISVRQANAQPILRPARMAGNAAGTSNLQHQAQT